MPLIATLLNRVADRLRAHQRRLAAANSGGIESACPYDFSLRAAMAKGGSLRIVVVGANDGRINDPIFAFAQKFRDTTELFLVEPQKALLPHLRGNYEFHPKTTVINRAIGPAGSITLYSVEEAAWPRLNVPYAKDWPAYRAPTGVTSGDKGHVQRWLQKYGPKGENVDSMIAEQAVQCAPLPNALGRKVDSIDVLQVDTEGMDDAVIYNSGIDELKPTIVYFEAENLSKERLAKLKDFLEQRGYALGRWGRDVLAVLSVEMPQSGSVE